MFWTIYFLHKSHELLIIERITSFFRLVVVMISMIMKSKVEHNFTRARYYWRIMYPYNTSSRVIFR